MTFVEWQPLMTGTLWWKTHITSTLESALLANLVARGRVSTLWTKLSCTAWPKLIHLLVWKIIELKMNWNKLGEGSSSFLLPSSSSVGKQSQLLLKPTEVELGLQVGVEFDNIQFCNIFNIQKFHSSILEPIVLNTIGPKYKKFLLFYFPEKI